VAVMVLLWPDASSAMENITAADRLHNFK